MSLKARFATLVAASALFVGSAVPVSADVPTYRHKSEIPASMSDRLKLATRYVDTPGRTIRAASGPVQARQVVIGSSRFIVVSQAGRNSPREIAEATRRQTDCQVSRRANFRAIRKGGVVPIGYAMPCSG